MQPEAGSPADWLRHAESDLALSRIPATSEVLPETLAFHAQQAVEKSLKAVLLNLGIEPPRTHNIKILLEFLPRTLIVPEEILQSAELTDYAVTVRYPGEYEPVGKEELDRAVRIAGAVVAWSASVVRA